MLSKSSITTAWPLAESLAVKGFAARPRPNTVLAALCRYTPIELVKPEVLDNISPEDHSGFLGVMAETVTGGTPEAPSEHDREMQALVQQLSGYIKPHLSFAKNVAGPLLEEYISKVIEDMQKWGEQKASDVFTINVGDLPEIVNNDLFRSDLDNYQGQTLRLPNPRPALGEKTHDEILALMMTGNKSIDTDIVNWISRKDSGFIAALWNSYFSTTGGTYNWVLDPYDLFDRADIAAFLFLVARRLFDQVDESASGVNLSVYRDTMAQVRDFGGTLLYSCCDILEGLAKTNTLVVGIQPDKYRATVCGPVYREWLKNEGSPEIIMGLIVSGTTLSTLQAITSAGAELTQKYDTFMHFFDTRQSNAKLSTFREVLLMEYERLMQTLAPEEKEYLIEDSNYYQEASARVREIVMAVENDDLTCIHRVCLKVIAQGRLYYTDSYKILSAMWDAQAINPNIEPREAAAMAAIQYAADFIADQIEIAA